MKLIFFGGTFDPPHLGHLSIIKFCIKKFEQVVLVPAYQSPNKKNSPHASSKDRLKMLELLISKICPIGLEIKKLMSDEQFLYKVLKEGNLKANSVAKNNLNKIYDKVGLIKFN